MAEDVSAWRAAFDEVFAGIAGMFGRAESRRWARSYLTGLLAPVERKNSWQLSDAAGVVGPDGLQHFLNRSRWDADELRDRLRSYVTTAMIARTVSAGVTAGWVAADSAYGRDGKLRAFCEARRLSYVLEVPVRQTVNDLDGRRRVDTLVGRAPAGAWHRVSAGLGERG
ncbi:hypothetical protein BOX37_12745 [Nocardia mangyaensis]|uniref:Transposase IS701-like DDE domain-containing protein n=1 Tax=Nocardia mangyaensis TaxID=2213200 RepID=A0A1J0VRM3_9NOCA|nr:hypothetical protein BOX37_12745 [Nocardia mangyaensis]